MSVGAFLQAVGTGDYGGGTLGAKSSRLGKYRIRSKDWNTWAAAAGLPNARWGDPKAQDRVAGWAARDLYNKLGAWDLVAYAWNQGAGSAYGLKLKGAAVSGGYQSLIRGSAKTYVDKVTGQMGIITEPKEAPVGPGPARPTFQPGSVSFTSEQPTEEQLAEAEPERRRANPAHVSLMGVLDGMSNTQAGGRRLSIQDVETQRVPKSDTEMSAPEQAKATEV